MKKAHIMAVLVTVFLAYANSAWAATPESLAGFVQVPAVKKYRDAWAKCGPKGDTCPDKKSSADATRLRKEAIDDCLKAFVDNAPERVGPCKTAVAASPEIFSMKVVETVRPPKPPIEVVKPPEPQPEPNETPPDASVGNFVTRDELQNEIRMAVRMATKDLVVPPQPAPPANVPGWLLFITWWNLAMGLVSLGLALYAWRHVANRVAEAGFVTHDQVAVMIEPYITYEQQNRALDAYLQSHDGSQILKTSILQTLKATSVTQDQLGRNLEERVSIFQKLKELEEDALEELKRSNPNDPGIVQAEGRIGFLDTHIVEIEKSLKQVRANQGPKQ